MESPLRWKRIGHGTCVLGRDLWDEEVRDGGDLQTGPTVSGASKQVNQPMGWGCCSRPCSIVLYFLLELTLRSPVSYCRLKMSVTFYEGVTVVE